MLYFSIAGVGTCTVQNELKKNKNEIYQNETYRNKIYRNEIKIKRNLQDNYFGEVT